MTSYQVVYHFKLYFFRYKYPASVNIMCKLYARDFSEMRLSQNKTTGVNVFGKKIPKCILTKKHLSF